MRATQHFLFYALVLLVPRISLAQGVQSCDISAFQGNVSASDGPYPALACQTCVFPVYQCVNGLDTTKILLLELSNKWIYFLGDSTTRQLHEQFLAYLDEPQVRNSLSIINEAPKETASIPICGCAHTCRRLCILERRAWDRLCMTGSNSQGAVIMYHHLMIARSASRTSKDAAACTQHPAWAGRVTRKLMSTCPNKEMGFLGDHGSVTECAAG
jgi:hypothetical protein